jgi:CHAT domain-containing protein
MFSNFLIEHSILQNNISNFVSNSNIIFSKLFQEVNFNFIEQITIIPDGILNYLPFELLLTEEVDTTKPINWFELPYLFKKVNINYQYSARLASMKRETRPNNKGVLGFAPQYEGYVSDDRAFGNLIYNQRELESIEKYFPGEFYRGPDADKQTFLEKASDFKVIHLASHAMADNENPELSSLFFTDINQDSTDIPLYPYEIQSTPLNADMVVLSACQSGTGKLHQGEGVFSLARNFIAAGAKSVVNSLWKVDDESTSKLMGYFYENLAKGQRKSEALRNAKLTFLENADAMTSHPYFWSGFVVIGDDSPIVNKSRLAWLIVGGALILCIIGGMRFSRGKRKKIQTLAA